MSSFNPWETSPLQIMETISLQPVAKSVLRYLEIVRRQASITVDLSQAEPTKRGWFTKMTPKSRDVQVGFIIEATIGITDVSFRCGEAESKPEPRIMDQLTRTISQLTFKQRHKLASLCRSALSMKTKRCRFRKPICQYSAVWPNPPDVVW